MNEFIMCSKGSSISISSNAIMGRKCGVYSVAQSTNYIYTTRYYRSQFFIDKFLSKYGYARRFVRKSKLFNEFLKFINNDRNVLRVKKVNDGLHIPPVVTFVRYFSTMSNGCITSYDKQSIGACFAYLFRFIMNYTIARRVAICKPSSAGDIRNASYFM